MIEILRWLFRKAQLTFYIVPPCFILPGPQKTCIAEAGIVIFMILCVCVCVNHVRVSTCAARRGPWVLREQAGCLCTTRVSHTQAYLFGPLQGVCGLSILLCHLGAMRKSLTSYMAEAILVASSPPFPTLPPHICTVENSLLAWGCKVSSKGLCIGWVSSLRGYWIMKPLLNQ